MVSELRFPKRWGEKRVKQFVAELDARTEDDWIASDEAAVADDGEQTVITLPRSLLPEIRRMLAAAKKA
jgi:hypothetical protein